MEDARPGGVRVAFQPTVEDYLAIFREQVWSSRSFVVARFTAALLAVLLTATALAGGASGAGWVAPALAVLATLALWVVAPAFVRRGIVRRYGPGANPPAVEYRVDAEGVHGRSAWAAWPDVTRVKETPQAFLVWMRPGAGAYLPRRAMGQADVAALRALFETNARGRARLRSD